VRDFQPSDTFTGSEYIRNAFGTGLGRKRVFGVFRAHGTCVAAENVVFFTGGANSASSEPLAELGESLRSEGKRGERKGRREKGRKKRAARMDGRKHALQTAYWTSYW